MGTNATYRAKGVEYLVKIYQYLSLGDFGDVVHSLTGVVSHPRVLVSETGEHRRCYLREISGQFLRRAERAT